MIRLATDNDIGAWLDIAKEVEPLFGAMAEDDGFKAAIKDCVGGASALCAVDGNSVEGVIAFDKERNEIAWLAVRERSRSKGYGRELLKAALERLDGRRAVFVQTFSAAERAGEAARRLYVKFGFKDYKDGGMNPAGIGTVIMALEYGRTG